MSPAGGEASKAVVAFAIAAFALILAAMATGVWIFFSPFAAIGIVTFVACAMVGALLYARWAAKQKMGLQALAAQQGWAYLESDGSDRPYRYLGLVPIRENGIATNILTGRHQGLPFEAFTFTYMVGNGKNKHSVSHAVVAVVAPVQGPDLRIQPETLGQKARQAVGGGTTDIDFESDEFSRRYWVTSTDRKFAYDVITPAMMDLLLADPDGWQWQWRGPWLIAYKPMALSPKNALAAVTRMRQFAAKVPRNVLAAGTGKVSPAPRAAQPFNELTKEIVRDEMVVQFKPRGRRVQLVALGSAACMLLGIALAVTMASTVKHSPLAPVAMLMVFAGFCGIITSIVMAANRQRDQLRQTHDAMEQAALRQATAVAGIPRTPPRTP